MLNKFLKTVMAILAVFISFYAFRYLTGERMFGLLQLKSNALLNNVFWNIGFYSHIIPGGIALLVGWLQFNENFRTKKLVWHHRLGKLYVSAALISSVAGIYIAFYATAGITTSLGFMGAGLTWFYTTYRAYSSIRSKDIDTHKEMMTYSYAVCFAAITLRFYLPLLSLAFGSFMKAYMVSAWLCWVPNLLVAFYINKRQKKRLALQVI